MTDTITADNEYEYLGGEVSYKYKLQCIIRLCPSLDNNMHKSNNEIKRQFLSLPKMTHT